MKWGTNAWGSQAWYFGAWETRGLQANFALGQPGVNVTIPLVGFDIACSAGEMNATSRGQVINTGIGIAVPNMDVPLVGIPIATAGGLLSPAAPQPALTGMEIAMGLGILTPQGADVTVHLSGFDIFSFMGVMDSGSKALTGQAAAVLAGTFDVRSITVPLVGLPCTIEQGIVALQQDADDILIRSSLGTVTNSSSIPLVGIEVATAGGLVSVTGDIFLPLTGLQIDTAFTTVEANKPVELTGLEIATATGVFGAPGMAALTGIQVNTFAGQVFLNNDREYPLTGLAVAVEYTPPLVSTLAFPTGLEILVEQQPIGPRTIELTGIEVRVEQGILLPPRVVPPPGGDDCPKKKKKKKKRFLSDREFYRVAFEQLGSTKKPEAVAKAIEQELLKKSVPISKALLTAAETTVPAAQLEAKREAEIQKALYKRAAELAQEEAEVIKVLFS